MRCILFVSMCLVFGIGCGGVQAVADAGNKTDEAPPKKKAETLEERLKTAYDGPKLRVAVSDLKMPKAVRKMLKKLGWGKSVAGLVPLLAGRLVQTERVMVLERKQASKVLGNLMLEKESKFSRFVDQSTTSEIGKWKGAQAVLVAEVSQFEPKSGTSEGGAKMPVIGGVTYSEEASTVGIDMRLVEQETGAVIVAGRGVAKLATAEMEYGVSYAGIKLGGEASGRTSLSSAFLMAFDKALTQLVSGIKNKPWQSRIISVMPEYKLVAFEGGSGLGLREGDIFRVYHRVKPIKNAEGKITGYMELKGGTVKINSIAEDQDPPISNAVLVEGQMPKEGDVVRFEKAPKGN